MAEPQYYHLDYEGDRAKRYASIDALRKDFFNMDDPGGWLRVLKQPGSVVCGFIAFGNKGDVLWQERMPSMKTPKPVVRTTGKLRSIQKKL